AGHPEGRNAVRGDRGVAEEIDLQRGEPGSERLARDAVASDPVGHALLEDETHGFSERLGEVGRHRHRLVAPTAFGHPTTASRWDPPALPSGATGASHD